MPVCAALNCGNKDNKDTRKKGITFHKFPLRKPALLEKWTANIKRVESNGETWQPKRSTLLCSAHFTAECVDRTGQTVRLREEAVPTIFDFKSTEHLGKDAKQMECGSRTKSLRVKLASTSKTQKDEGNSENKNEDEEIPPETEEEERCIFPSASEDTAAEVQTQKRDWSFLSKSVYTQWKQLGRMQGLNQDDEIATFLLKHYKDTQKKLQIKVMLCETCSNPLTISCLRCNWTIKDMTDATCLKSPLPPTVITKEEGMDLDRNEGGSVRDNSCLSQWPASDSEDTSVLKPEGVTKSKVNENASVVSCDFFPQHQGDDADDNEDSCTDQEYDSKESMNECDNSLRDSGASKNERDHFDKVCIANINDSFEDAAATQCDEEEFGDNRKIRTEQERRDQEKMNVNMAGSSPESMQASEISLDHNYNRSSQDIPPIQETSKSTVHKDVIKPSAANSFLCGVCGKSYKYSKNLKSHMACHSQRSFTCDICKKSFHKTFVLRSHKQIHVKRPFTCAVCSKNFMTEEKLIAHKRVHNPFVCDVCEKTFTDPDKFQKHKERHEHDLIMNTCRKGSDLDIHEPSSTTNPKRYACALCDKAFNKPYLFRRHMASHNPTTRKTFMCDQCGKGFTFRGNLRRHQMIHSGAKPFECTFCGKGFIRSVSLKTHMFVHTGEKPYVCEKCGRAFTQVGALRIHKEIHTSGNMKPFMCDLCGKTFKQNIGLKLHIQNTHYIQFRQSSSNSSRPTQHAKVFKCEVCEKTFTMNFTLKAHMRIHTGEKPYMCSVCGRAFTFWGNFQRHKQVHSGLKPYKCDVCLKSFAHSTTLKTHKIIHTGLKPFKCDTCGKSFSDRSTLIKHKKTHLER